MSEINEDTGVVLGSRVVGALPGDLVFTAAFSVFAAVVYSVPSFADAPWLPLVGLPVLLFVPGYTLVAVAFPTADNATTRTRFALVGLGGTRRRTVDLTERVALSFGMSLAFLPPVALLGWTVGMSPMDAPLALAALGFVGSVVGAVRRVRLPAAERFTVPYGDWLDSLVVGFGRGRLSGRLLNLLLALSVLFAGATIGYAFVVPNSAESYSSLYLVTENDAGELVAAGYPSEFTLGETQTLVVGIQNEEAARTSYTVVTELQRVQAAGDQVSVVEEQELDRFEVTLESGERWEAERGITPGLVGDDLRVQYLLYTGTAPADAQADSAYRTAHIWISVSEGEA